MGKPGVGGDQGKIGGKVTYDFTIYIVSLSPNNFLHLDGDGIIFEGGGTRGFCTGEI